MRNSAFENTESAAADLYHQIQRLADELERDIQLCRFLYMDEARLSFIIKEAKKGFSPSAWFKMGMADKIPHNVVLVQLEELNKEEIQKNNAVLLRVRLH